MHVLCCQEIKPTSLAKKIFVTISENGTDTENEVFGERSKKWKT